MSAVFIPDCRCSHAFTRHVEWSGGCQDCDCIEYAAGAAKEENR